jgi:glycosyltransferase involved in cell wall biosynthesis
MSAGSMLTRPDSGPATVLYVANAAKIGGGNRVLMDLMTHLDTSRYKPVLVSPDEGALTDWARSTGIRYHVSKNGDWQSGAALLRRAAALIQIIRRERAAIVHSAAPTCYRALGLAGRLTGVPRICHLGFPPAAGELERSFLSPPEAVVGCYVGQAVENEAEIRRLRADCHVVGICNGIDTSRFTTTAAGFPDRFRQGADHVVAILGHISEVKGHPTFIEAAGRLAQAFPSSRFLVVGGDTLQQGLKPTLESRAAVLGLGSRLDFLGFRQDVPDILAAADVVVLPSRAEGFPLAVLEAMSCGKPVVATPVGGVPEALVDGVTGMFVPPDRADALADAVAHLFRHPGLSRQMGIAARQRVEERFSVAVFAGAVQSLYHGLMQQRLRGRLSHRLKPEPAGPVRPS